MNDHYRRSAYSLTHVPALILHCFFFRYFLFFNQIFIESNPSNVMRILPAVKILARRESPYLPLLLPTLRDIDSARRELRWIAEHFHDRAADGLAVETNSQQKIKLKSSLYRKIWKACFLRGYKGVPLQYILGSQPFGDSLDIICRPGVLIPRWETEEWGVKIARGIRQYHPFFNGEMSSYQCHLFCTVFFFVFTATDD